jgi:glucose/mannose transport system substrate-binding protein
LDSSPYVVQRDVISLPEHSVRRRRFVEAAGLGAVSVLTGCSRNLLASPAERLEVLHGWAEGDGATAIQSLVESFESRRPDVEAKFTQIAGGGNENLNTVVDYRIHDGDPPGSFANWAGKNLQRYDGALGTVDDVWAANDFEDVHVDEAVDLHRYDGAFRAVPIGSHRLNDLFYNVEVVESAGVDPDAIESVDALVDALAAVKSETDATPMTHAMAGTWTTTQLWAAVMLGQEGYQPYVDFIEGNGSERAVRATFETTANLLENYITYDASSLDMLGSNVNIIEGNAAFIHQGNWAAGTFAPAEDFEYGRQWDAIEFPGTANMYTLHVDSFVYPADNPTPQRSKTWLEFVGGETAQIAFNRHKGSIPTRTDIDMSEFNQYLQETATEFQQVAYRPPSLQHGLAVSPDEVSALNRVISDHFSGPYDVDVATAQFLDVVNAP